MSTFATVIVTKANQAAAQELTSSEMFTTEVKKTLRSYFISSGYFEDEHFNSLLDSDLVHTMVTDDTERPTHTLQALGMTFVVTGED